MSKLPRLLSGTTNALLDSMMTHLRHIGDGALPRKVEIWKLVYSFLDVFLEHPVCQIPQSLLSETSSVLLDSKDETWRKLGRSQELDHFLGWQISENWYEASLMYAWDIHYVKNQQDSTQESQMEKGKGMRNLLDICETLIRYLWKT